MIKVYGEIQAEDPDVYLKLATASDGTIMLVACDDRGNEIADGVLLVITPKGTFQRRGWVNSDLGFPLDCGKIIVE